jgi:probable F420-dependent oxidoreductase
VGYRETLGRVGIWSSAWSRAYDSGEPELVAPLADAAAELDSLGYGGLWLGGSPPLEYAGRVLASTSRIVVATGILSIWRHEAGTVAAQRAELARSYPDRFLLGLGVSHAQLSSAYQNPYRAMVAYLDGLDAATEPVPASGRVLAALGSKMLALSRERSAGAHPYLVTVGHTARARQILGPDALLAPEFKVVLDDDHERARQTARGYLARYLALPNYTANLARDGFTEDDFRDGGSDRLLDAVFALGSPETVALRFEAYLAAGADHVAVQVVHEDPLPLAQWRLLAGVLVR